MLCAATVSLPPNDARIFWHHFTQNQNKCNQSLLLIESNFRKMTEHFLFMIPMGKRIYLHNYKTSNMTRDIQILLLNSFFSRP